MLDKHLTQTTARARITLVDTATRTVEGTIRDGSQVTITLFEVPASFVWPQTGEQWTITRKSGIWTLGHRLENVDEAQSVQALAPGEGKLDGNTFIDRHGRLFVAIDLTDIEHGDQVVWDAGVQAFVPASKLGPAP
jgi:hypothetical protein